MSATIPVAHSWVDSEMRHLNHIKMTAWRRTKRSAKCSGWNKFKKLRKQLKKRLKHKYQVKTNPKNILVFFITEPAAKANLFNNYVPSVFAKDQSPARCNANNVRPAEINLSSIEFHYWEVQKILSGLDANKA